MFFGDDAYKEPMKQLLFQIIVYNFNVFEVRSAACQGAKLIVINFLANCAEQILGYF